MEGRTDTEGKASADERSDTRLDAGEPILVYDDDCGFCTWWAEFFDARSKITVVGFSELPSSLRDRLPVDYEECSHFLTDGEIYSCGKSIEEAFTRSDVGTPTRPLIERLREYETYERLREWGYHHVAGNRSFWGRFLSSRSSR